MTYMIFPDCKVWRGANRICPDCGQEIKAGDMVKLENGLWTHCLRGQCTMRVKWAEQEARKHLKLVKEVLNR